MRTDLLNSITTVLEELGADSPMLQSRARTDKVFEVFVWSCTLRALTDIGATLVARNHLDQPTTTLDFRLAPGLIYNPTSAPSFVLVTYKGNEYELQNGLRVLGSSKVLHELDICILERAHAQRCRRNSIDPVNSAVRFLAECKCYGGSLPLNVGREYLGLSSEFSIRVKTLAANQTSPEVHTLIKRHGGTTHFELAPSNATGVNQFIGWLATELKHAL